MNESKNLSGIMSRTCDLPTIKKMEINDNEDEFDILRFCGIMIVAALSCLTFVYFPM